MVVEVLVAVLVAAPVDDGPVHGPHREVDRQQQILPPGGSKLGVEQNDSRAIEKKLKGLDFGMYGYKQDKSQAREFNERLIQSGNREAVHRKIDALSSTGLSSASMNRYGYAYNAKDAYVLNDSLIEINDAEAIVRKIRNKLMNNIYNIYKNDQETLIQFITKHRDAGRRWAQYLYVQGLKWGTFDFDRDRNAAKAYILKYHIPF